MRINWDKLSRMNIIGLFEGVVPETVVVERLERHMLTDEVHKLADITGTQAKDTCDWIEVGDIVLTILKSVWICG